MNECNSTRAQRQSPFGVYVHIPFCVHKCSYCDFYSFTQHQKDDFKQLTEAIVGEIREAARWLKANGRHCGPTRSVFFGGGTPSLLPVGLTREILLAIDEHFGLPPGVEITLEANPETVTPAFSEELAATRVNRVSLGAQSFKAAHLQKLERLGSRESIKQAVKLLRSAGLTNYSLDLIFGIPGQTEREMKEDLDELIALGPGHASFYNLTLKPAHTLYRNLPSDDETADLYQAGILHLAQAGFEQYEVSNFAQPGKESQHNLLYWDGGDFLGVGPSAASRFFWNGHFWHRKQLSDYRQYVTKRGAFAEPAFEKTTHYQTVLEASFLELRKNSGVQLTQFARRYGYRLERAKKYPLFLKEGILERQDDNLKLSRRGLMLADTVTSELVDVF